MDKELAEWREKDPGNELAWQQTICAWDQLGSMLEDEAFATVVAEAADQAARPVSSRRPATTRGWRNTLAGLVATLDSQRGRIGLFATAVVLLAIGVFWTGRPAAYASSAEVEVVVLDDGTKVNLDLDSRMRVVMRDRSREITLVQGQALFDVAPDPRRPFSVTTGGMTVVATGTEFVVNGETGRPSVTLVRGSVTVTTPGTRGPLPLVPGDRVTWDNKTRRIARSQVSAASATSWTEGFLEFDRTPLADAAREFNRHATSRVLIADRSLDNVPVSGVFKRNEPTQFAEVLPYVLPVRVSKTGNDIVIARR